MMFRKKVKKGIATLLVFLLLLTMIPLSAFAETTTPSTETEDEYIYNSDLFFGYSIYLTETYNNALLSLEQHRMQTTNNIIHQDYIHTGHFYTSVVSQGLSIATDPAGTVKYFTDYVGATNFQFNDELDKANVSFVKKLCETNLLLGEASSLIKENNKYIKKMNGFLKAVQSVEKAGLLDEAYYAGLNKAEVYSTMYEQSMAYYKEYFTQINPSQSFNTQLHTALSEMTNALGGITTAADFTYALCLSLLMQDAQIELIQDIIDTQPTTSTLYKGLTRLKNQLKNGWMSYFIDTFVKGKVYEQVVGKVSGEINKWIMGDWTSYYSAVTAVVKAVNTVVFEWILGADYSAYRSALMLDTYASDLCDSVKNKAKTFQTAGFTTKDIEKYELLFNAYIAMSEASLDACQDLAIHNTTYTSSYLNQQLEFYNNDDIYTDYLNNVKSFILSIPKENRIITDFGTWEISKKTTLINSSDIIEEGYLYCLRQGFPGNVLKDYDNYQMLIFAENQEITIDGDLILNQRIGTAATIPATTSVRIKGNFLYNKYDGSGYSGTESTIDNYGSIKIDGYAKFTGSYSYYFGGYKKANFNNYGSIEVDGNLTMMEAAGTLQNDGNLICNGELGIYNLGTINNNNYISTGSLTLYSYYKEPVPYQYSTLNMAEDAILEVSNDIFIRDWTNKNILKGKLVLNGTEQQKLEGLNAYNIEVKNPAGIKYLSNVSIYGEYKLNGNPLDNNGYKTYCYTGASFGDNSDYKELYITDDNTITLEQSITGNFTGGVGGGLVIPNNTVVIVDGSVLLLGSVINNGTLTVVDTLHVNGKSGGITNNGELHALSDFLLTRNNLGYGYVEMSNASAILTVAGNFSLESSLCSKISNGKVFFNGVKQQTITNLWSPTIVLENKSDEGVVFSTAIRPSVLFDHKGNNFTLVNNGDGSSFVDYDGDGLKDNVDPEPTVGNPCTITVKSEDTEKGTVSVDSIETVGGTTLTVTATPTFKYNFVKWINSTGTTVSTSAEYSFVAKNDQILTAVFSRRKQPITTHTVGGTINVSTTAEIESEVAVTVTENDGYVYTEGSLAYNGIPVENGSFVMPDDKVVITAEFVRNDNYFTLKEMLTTAKGYTYEPYSRDSFANLTATINTAETALVNNITAEESENQIALLQNAIDGLEDKYITAVSLNGTPILYINVPDMINNISFLVTYDNGTTITVTGAESTIVGFDAGVLGQQTITVTYGGFSSTVDVTVRKRVLYQCAISGITNQIYDGIKTEYTITPTITYYRTNDVLIENIDYKVEYSNNNKIGVATIIITGIGDYTGSRSLNFNIYCEHAYEISQYIESTCMETGIQREKCSICDAYKVYENIVTTGLPETPHSYSNNMNTWYEYSDDGATKLALKFSSQTKTEGCDYIYIYDGSDNLIGQYSNTSLAGKTIDITGDTVKIHFTSDYSVVYYGFSFDYITGYFESMKLPLKEHTYSENWTIDTIPTSESAGQVSRHCEYCDSVTDIQELPYLKIAGATLTLYDDISVNYMVSKDLFDGTAYTNPYMVFEFNGKQTKVTNYTISGNYYCFSFANVAPDKMNDTIKSTLYASVGDTLLSSDTREYSIAEYCYSMLDYYSTDAYANLRTLLVDLLNYGAYTQNYTGHNTENLVNANLTDEQKVWASGDIETFTDALNTKYATVDNPTVKWRGAELELNSAITMKFVIQTDSIEGLTVKITDDNGHSWNVKSSTFKKYADGYYYVYFNGLDASQMSDNIYLTVYSGDTIVSNTVRYSIESYASAMKDSTNDKLSTLVHSMMKYGNSAKQYKNKGAN